jgi:hypothetical protein
MPHTTTWRRLTAHTPESETDWRDNQAAVHRLRGFPGDDSWCLTNRLEAEEIRKTLIPGSSRQMRFCPRCLDRGIRVALIFMGGIDRCGNCLWPSERKDVRIPGL